MASQWDAQMEAFGAFIRSQRKLANLTLRQLAELTSLSNPYLSELERGMHQPSVRVLRQLSNALNLSGESCWPRPGCSILTAATATRIPTRQRSSTPSRPTHRSTTRRKLRCLLSTRA